MTKSSQPIQAVAADVGRRLATELNHLASQNAWSNVAAVMDKHLAELAATECWGEANQLPSSVFWREAGDVLREGSLQFHARFKPHGYAGDFEMLERLVQQDARGEGLALAFDQYFQSHPAPQAVRNRTAWVAQAILDVVHGHSDRSIRVVSIGSGPSADIRQAVAEMNPDERSRLHVVLLDLDAKGLEFSRLKLTSMLREEQVVICRENLFRLPRRKPSPEMAADLVICTGLFDYLPDVDAIAMLGWMDAARKPGGRSVMMNFSPANGSRAYMEWAGMWHLIHRTEAEVASLAERAGFCNSTWELTAEPLGIDLILDKSE